MVPVFVRRLAVLVVAGLLLPLSACGLVGNGRPVVVTSFYPLQFIAGFVAGRYDHVVDLTPPGVEPHDYELTVQQTAMVNEATLGFYEHGLAPSIDQAMANDAPRHVLDVTSVIHLHAPAPGYNLETADNQDPHFWQDPVLMQRVAAGFTRAISAAQPRHAAYFRARGALLHRKLAALDRAYAATLRTCRIRTLVVSHDAFEYLGRRYHLQIQPIAGLQPDAEPSPQRLQQLGQIIRQRHITTVFSEVLASPALADSLASDLGISTATLDPIEGLTPADAHATYLTLMRANLRAITKANRCR